MFVAPSVVQNMGTGGRSCRSGGGGGGGGGGGERGLISSGSGHGEGWAESGNSLRRAPPFWFTMVILFYLMCVTDVLEAKSSKCSLFNVKLKTDWKLLPTPAFTCVPKFETKDNRIGYFKTKVEKFKLVETFLFLTFVHNKEIHFTYWFTTRKESVIIINIHQHATCLQLVLLLQLYHRCAKAQVSENQPPPPRQNF